MGKKYLGIILVIPFLIILAISSISCASDDTPILKIGGIPDQDAARLARRYEDFSKYLSDQLQIQVEYVPSINYAAVVTAFTQNELQVAFFGGLTGVQARLQNPGAVAIVQRVNDAKFNSIFVANPDLELTSLEDLNTASKDLTITFGSESSTSGHLWPRHFLEEAGIDPAVAFKSDPNFSGSHDLTWKLVEGGSFDIGALSESVWKRAKETGKADLSKVEEFYITPDYFNYNWTVRPGLDKIYGQGFTNNIRKALLNLNMEEHSEILELFSTDQFIETNNANYTAIQEVAENLGIIK